MSVPFSKAVEAIQEARGARAAYARVGDFESLVTPELADFLSGIDTAFLATASADGQPYVQHRGGPRGFLRVVDEHTIGFADFTGNRQYISTGNLTENDKVCLIAMDYAHRRRVKIWGRAHIVPGNAGLAHPTYKARIEQTILITVSAWDVNCPQHIPQLVPAAEVEPILRELRTRIATLEAELAARDSG
jgi:uncharacterized protein